MQSQSLKWSIGFFVRDALHAVASLRCRNLSINSHKKSGCGAASAEPSQE